MIVPDLVAVALVALAVALALPPRRGAGLRRAVVATAPGWSVPGGPWHEERAGPGDVSAEGSRGERPDESSHPLQRHRLLVALAAALLLPVVLGGPVGWVGGLGAAAWVWRVVSALEPPGRRRRREGVQRDLPHAVDLLAVVLASGASPASALAAVADAVGAPLDAELGAVRRGLDLGRDPVEVWHEAGRRPGLSTLARAMVRALDGGAPVAEALHRLAEDLHASRRLDDEARARAVGVKVAAPLGLCLLPAFVLVGVVPLVGSTVRAFVVP